MSDEVVEFLNAVGFVIAAASMIYVVNRFEPNRPLARVLMTVIYVTVALAVLNELGFMPQ